MKTISELSAELEKEANNHPDIADLLKTVAEKLRWQDERYRMLSKIAWGDLNTPPLLVPRNMVK